MNGFDTLLFDKREGIAYIGLNRPHRLNSYNLQMRDELHQVLEALKDDAEVRVAILFGEGKAFCAGADLTEFLTAPSPTMAREARWQRDVWGLFLSLTQPLIAAVHGYVLGSGLEIALCCDLRIAAEDALFGLPEVGLGLIPAAGGTQNLPRTVKPGWAEERVFLGDFISAQEAYRIGLINRVVARAQLLASAEVWAKRIQTLPYSARLKQLVKRGLDMPLAQGLKLEGLG